MRYLIWPSNIIRRAVVPLAAACLLLLAGPAQAIVGGQPDGNRHPYVGALFQGGRFFCSGELVSATKVLSAAPLCRGPLYHELGPRHLYARPEPNLVVDLLPCYQLGYHARLLRQL
jgi:hypothetical protein